MKLKKVSVYFLTISFLLLQSCGSNDEVIIKDPDYLIPEDTFKLTLFDLFLLEGYATRNPEKLKKMDTLYERKSMYILEKYNLEETRFKRSYNFYLTQPERLERIYEEVLEELTKRQASLSSPKDTLKTQ